MSEGWAAVHDGAHYTPGDIFWGVYSYHRGGLVYRRGCDIRRTPGDEAGDRVGLSKHYLPGGIP